MKNYIRKVLSAAQRYYRKVRAKTLGRCGFLAWEIYGEKDEKSGKYKSRGLRSVSLNTSPWFKLERRKRKREYVRAKEEARSRGKSWGAFRKEWSQYIDDKYVANNWFFKGKPDIWVMFRKLRKKYDWVSPSPKGVRETGLVTKEPKTGMKRLDRSMRERQRSEQKGKRGAR